MGSPQFLFTQQERQVFHLPSLLVFEGSIIMATKQSTLRGLYKIDELSSKCKNVNFATMRYNLH